jgi:predicted transcriptional regulator
MTKPGRGSPIIVSSPSRGNSFSSLLVGDIMRRSLLLQQESTSLHTAIALLIKHKADALLVVDRESMPVGVVTKTEVMSAYFGELSVQTALGEIMGGPVIACRPEDTLQAALETMQDRHIHRIYVVDPDSGRAVGTLSYPDIVGILYRYCCRCDRSLHSRRRRSDRLSERRLSVGEVMHRSVITASCNDTIEQIIELLACYRIGALLLMDGRGRPAGVLSKTDLALAYRRAVPLAEKAATIMQRSVRCCRETDQLESAIRQMIFAEVSRLFVTAPSSESVVGIVTLTDAARVRSGSCRACTNSRIIPKGER